MSRRRRLDHQEDQETASERRFQEVIAEMRGSQEEIEEKRGRAIVMSRSVQAMMKIVEEFIIDKGLVCYGGTAINNILPIEDQFYKKEIEIPDYDFFTPDAYNDARELADIFRNKKTDDGQPFYHSVVASAGVHLGTYKVFVDFIPVADLTQMGEELFGAVQKNAIVVDSMKYAPPDYLRMAMYLELSRPDGMISRWEKVLTRLRLLNKHYPLRNPACDGVKFIRDFEGTPKEQHRLYSLVRDSLIEQGLVFFGGFAATLYAKHMPHRLRRALRASPDFDVLSTNPEQAFRMLKEKLVDGGFAEDSITMDEMEGIDEIVAPHYIVSVGKEIVCIIYEPLACHNYNTITMGKRRVKVATIDTMLSFYLAFLYADRPYFDHERIICMAQYLLKAQESGRSSSDGLLRRFSKDCYGHQVTLEEIRANKAAKFHRLDRESEEYKAMFMRYEPREASAPSSASTRKRKRTSSGTTAKSVRTRSHKRRHRSAPVRRAASAPASSARTRSRKRKRRSAPARSPPRSAKRARKVKKAKVPKGARKKT